jgi:hypothetical protein
MTRKKSVINIIGINPFKQEITVPTRNVNKYKNVFTKNKNNFEEIGFLKTKVTHEDISFTKLYHNTEYRNVLLNLSNEALKLWLYLMYSLEPNNEYVTINRPFVTKLLKLPNQSRLKYLLETELIAKNILRNTEDKNTFWINAEIAFHGSRIETFPENIKIRT